MLKRFRVSNFKSLHNVEFRPVGLNLLIGPNNAGKTNLCSSLRFVSLTSSLGLEEAAKMAVGETWNIPNVYVNSSTMEFEVEATLVEDQRILNFQYVLWVNAEKGASLQKQSLSVTSETLKVTGGVFNETLLVENKAGEIRLLHEGRYAGAGGQDSYVRTSAPRNATMLSRLYDLEGNRYANLFKRYLQSWHYYNFNPHALRSPEVVNEKPILRHDGGNLSKVIFELHNQQPRTEKKIIEIVRSLEPKLDLFSFSSPDPDSVYLFLEDQEGHRFSAQSMSDGILRYLAMTYLIISSANKGNEATFSPLVLVEEPENGLYVGHLKPLLEKIDQRGSGGQFIFTTHSPYFIDLFDKNLDGLTLLRPGKTSSILVKPDPEKVRKLLDEMPLGELHYREMLG